MIIRVILAAKPGVVNTAGSVLVSWMLAQIEYRSWVREVEDGTVYQDAEALR